LTFTLRDFVFEGETHERVAGFDVMADVHGAIITDDDLTKVFLKTLGHSGQTVVVAVASRLRRWGSAAAFSKQRMNSCSVR